MPKPWTRREAIGTALIGGAAVAQGTTIRGTIVPSGSSTTGIMTIGLFSTAGKVTIPAGNDLVQTDGYTRVGQGQALYAYDPKLDARQVAANPRTSFFSANGRGFRIAEAAIDVQQVGAVGDGVSDDTAAVQAALDAAEAAGGGAVIFPKGEYKITSTLNLPAKVNIEGFGQSSILRAYRCNCINIMASDIIGPRRIADLWIYGYNAEKFSAICSNIVSPDRVSDLIFEGLYISFFGSGVNCRGLWHCTFRNVTMNQIWRGFRFYDRNVKISIDDCHVIHGGMIDGEGYSIGLQVGDPLFKLRPEDIQVQKTIIYGFEKAIVWRMALFGGVTNCDLDACSNTGIEIVTADGGFVFRDNWVQVANDKESIYGINCVALGYFPELGNISISNNRISVRSNAKSYGMFFGNNQSNTIVDGNCIVGEMEEGIRADGTRQMIFSGNKINSGIWIGNSDNIFINNNFLFGDAVSFQNKNFSSGATFNLGQHNGLPLQRNNR